MPYEQTFFIIIILVTLINVHSTDGFICSCSCCTGNRCTRISPTNYTISTCEACESMCQNEFSSTCMKGASHVSYQCMNDALLSRQLGGPNWIGTFHATDECDTTDCCCLTDVVYFNRGNNNNLHIQGQFNGQCSSASPTVYAIYAMPNTYSAEFRFLNQPITVKLSADSQTISFMETDNMACRYKAVRVNNASFNTINWIYILLLSSLINSKKYFF